MTDTMPYMEQETLTLKFGGQANQVDLHTFAYSVLNFATVLKETNRKLTDRPIEIHIKSPEKGSVLVDIVTTIQEINSLIPDMGNITNLLAVIGGLYGFHLWVSGKLIKKKEKIEEDLHIELDDGSTFIVAENVYNIYVSTPAIPESISEQFSVLNDDPAVVDFQVKRRNKEIVRVNREDFPRLSIKQQFESENTKTVIQSAYLHICKLVFDKKDRKWEFYFNGNKISARITDNDFFNRVIAGNESFSNGDQLHVDLQITQVMEESVGIFVNQSYQVVKVHEHIKREHPRELPFDKKLQD